MTLLLLEALGAFLIFLFIVWWTMFSGRRKGELPESVEEEKKKAAKSSDAEPKP
jgi:cbb3-type cytochrome oxidase subunit 3